MIVVDSGLGGLSVVRALRGARAGLPLIYLADTGGFPYGRRTAADITARGMRIAESLVKRHADMPIVLACNTLSTLALGALRDHFSVPFVGTVPAIKTAAQISISRRFTLLATPNTAQSQYSQSLIGEFASDCVVDVYGAPNLAAYAEAMLLGDTVEDTKLRSELAPAFSNDALGRTDCIVLGCTHYPLIGEALTRVAPWPVNFIDSSEAIARRALGFESAPVAENIAYVTSKEALTRYKDVFAREGFTTLELLNVG